MPTKGCTVETALMVTSANPSPAINEILVLNQSPDKQRISVY